MFVFAFSCLLHVFFYFYCFSLLFVIHHVVAVLLAGKPVCQLARLAKPKAYKMSRIQFKFGSRGIACKTNPQNLTSLKKEEHISIAGWCVAKDTSKEQPMGIHNA